MNESSAVMLCGHGSRDPDAVREFLALGQGLRARLPGRMVASGFLEFARPTIESGLEALRDQGARRILALPGMLFAAGHVKNDLPWEMGHFASHNPQVELHFGRDLSVDLKLLRAASARIEQAEAEAPHKIARADTLLLVVGRGTNDPDANSNISKITRMLWEGMGFGWAETAYSGVTTPLVDAALERVARLGFARILVFPYFLFTGILVKRIYAWADEAASRHPGLDIVKAPYLSDHPLVIDTFLDRLAELEGGGAAAMNCSLCKYRERALGHEDEVGAVQSGHHHHVRGIGVDDHDHDHDHDHGHDHDHDHGHHHHHHGHE